MITSRTRPRRATRIALAASVAALSVLLAACSSGGGSSSGSSSSASGGSYTLGLAEPTSTIDPETTGDYNAMYVVGLASEGLISQNSKGVLQPRLASSWKAASDGLSWTVTLRKNVKFSNGKALGAKDVVATFDSIAGKDSQSPGASSFQGILKSVAPGSTADTVVFSLDRPFSDFPYLLTGSNTTILPASYKAGTNWIKDPVGAGQFILEKYTPGQSVTYKKNPDYWDAKHVKLSAVTINFYADAQAQLLAFQSGEIDQVAYSPTVASTLKVADYRQTTPAYNKFDGIFLNVKQAPLDDVAVRQAIALAIDRKAIVKSVYAGQATVADDYLYFPNYAVQPDGVPQREQDLAKVKQLLGGKKVRFTITTLTDEKTLAEVVQQQLNAVPGFDVSIKILTSAQYYADGASTPWLNAPVTITNWAQRLPSQYVNLLYKTGAAWNASKYSNPALEKLSNQYDEAKTTAEKQTLADRIATIENTDTAVIVPAFATGSYVLQKTVKGTFSGPQDFPGGFDFRGISNSK
ncbi:peptide ABC transporter substrate-binding protein [Frondihabitans sucicola]|uniref:Peptide ABC transporter substrate-binding protein n=1 Tax=Frondihabitans sucicola TaxID=1268041 RepID=A0ABN6Y5T0_9MICO|nr:ABC transporter substrate-binding protein [Frondihabitans sucicola]BDZ51318.1 peptide ABC transporter substrate-binding protein [Frondihabitans sucicola]